MAEITATLVKELREETGLGIMDCKKALNETGGDKVKAVEFLRKKGAVVAAKRAGRDTKEGKVLLTNTGTCVAAVDINCETDFVSKCDEFKKLSKDLAMQIAALSPVYVKKELNLLFVGS